MTNKDYSKIQRWLGFIEGLVSDCNTIVYDGVTGAINEIDNVLDKEMASKTAEEMVGEG
jgi:hypothetical protein